MFTYDSSKKVKYCETLNLPLYVRIYVHLELVCYYDVNCALYILLHEKN